MAMQATATIMIIALAIISGALAGEHPLEQHQLTKNRQGEAEKPGITEDEWMDLLPDDQGKILVATYCSMCHSLQYAVLGNRDRSQWLGTVEKMVLEHNAPINDEEIDLIVDYLSKHADLNNPIARLPLDVNFASAAALERLPFLTTDEIKGILEFRSARGPIKDLGQLDSVIEAEKLANLRAYLVVQGFQ